MITMSLFFALACSTASKATAAGSAPLLCLIISAPTLFAHISSCSIAAALNVSAAAKTTLLPS